MRCPLGNGLASALFGIPVNPDGSIHLAVTGYDDFGFTGAHGEEGDFDLFVDIFDGTGALLSSILFSDTLLSGGVLPFDLSTVTGAASFDAVTDNTLPLGPDPLDFMTFTGLVPGTAFDAEITGGGFDTILGWFDNGGSLIADDDDGGTGLLSKLSGIVPANGELTFAVSGYSDFGFVGAHGEVGAYTLELNATVVPAPGAAVLAMLGLGTLRGLRRRNRKA